MTDNKFNKLLELDLNKVKEKKGQFDYVSWAWAWGEFKKVYPEATYKIERFGEENKPYLEDGKKGVMVFTSVTAGGLTHDMRLPVMNYQNKALPSDRVTMFEINKTIMRCLVKNLAMFGLGLYIYAGEDLPEAPVEEKPRPKPKQAIKRPISDEEEQKRQLVENMFSIAKQAGIELVKVQERMASKYGKTKSNDLTREEIDEITAWLTQESFI